MPTNPLKIKDPRALLRSLFDVAVGAADPLKCVPPALPGPPGNGRTVVVGAGKASAAMAKAVEDTWQGLVDGVVVTRYGYAVACEKITVIEAAHPLPDDAGVRGAQAVLNALEGLTEDDLVIGLWSGGASSLLSSPAEGIAFEDKRAVMQALLSSGADIHDINTVRKHLSRIKGGRLAAACAPARVHNILISDVVGDDPSTIGSGPMVADPTTVDDARRVLEKYAIATPKSVMDFLHSAAAETPKPESALFARVETKLAATAKDALKAAAIQAATLGLEVVDLGAVWTGEASKVADEIVDIARTVSNQGETPRLLLSGGELTVTHDGTGRGGPNAEFLLALAMALNGKENVWALACDTDGIDGSEDNAGAILAPDTLARAQSAGLDARSFLKRHDSYGFFEQLGDLVMSGPTLTNVNDFRAILII